MRAARPLWFNSVQVLDLLSIPVARIGTFEREGDANSTAAFEHW